MAIERTLSIIKPDATKRNLTGKINAKFEDAGLRSLHKNEFTLQLRKPVLFMPNMPSVAFTVSSANLWRPNLLLCKFCMVKVLF